MTESLIRLIAFLTIKDWKNFARELLILRKNNSDINKLEEALLMSYLFLGFPSTITAFEHLSELFPERRQFKISSIKDFNIWKKRGLKLFRKIYNKSSNKLINKIRNMHPELSNWMIAEGYGKVLSRKYLDIKTRELLIITMLIITGWEKQLYSHYLGAMNVGVKPQEIENIFNVLGELIGNKKNIKKAILLWNERIKKELR